MILNVFALRFKSVLTQAHAGRLLPRRRWQEGDGGRRATAMEDEEDEMRLFSSFGQQDEMRLQVTHVKD